MGRRSVYWAAGAAAGSAAPRASQPPATPCAGQRDVIDVAWCRERVARSRTRDFYALRRAGSARGAFDATRPDRPIEKPASGGICTST